MYILYIIDLQTLNKTHKLVPVVEFEQGHNVHFFSDKLISFSLSIISKFFPILPQRSPIISLQVW